jgi:hypothetical protein
MGGHIGHDGGCKICNCNTPGLGERQWWHERHSGASVFGHAGLTREQTLMKNEAARDILARRS